MKKYIKILSIILIVIVATACGKVKEKLNDKQFTEKISNLAFVVTDNTSMIEDETIKSSYSAHNGKYQIEFYIFKDKKRAEEAYQSNKKYFENNGKKGKEKRKDTYSKYMQELSDTYNVLIRVDDTLLYSSINIDYKKELNKVLKELNY